MATSGVDRKMKIWDIRKFEMVHSYQIGCGAGHMVFSQTGALGLGKGNIVEVWRPGFVCVFVYVSLECLILLEVTTCIVQSIRRETHMISEV